MRIPDTYCRKKITSPQEMIIHVQQEHPWLGWTEEIAKKLFEEEIKEMEEYELEYEDNNTSEKADKMGLSSDKDTSDNVEIKLASNTNFNEMAKLQNFQVVHELDITENMSTDARSKIASLDRNKTLETHKVLESLLAQKQIMTKIDNVQLNQIEASNKETTPDVPPVHIAAVPPEEIKVTNEGY